MPILQKTSSVESAGSTVRRRAPSQRSLDSVGRLSRRSLPLSTSTTGEAFLDRLHYCCRILFNPSEDSSCFLPENMRQEDNWSEIITSELPKRRRVQQSAIWEFITTEKTYINRLNTIVRLFVALLSKLKDEGDLLDVDEFDLFANIKEVARANEQFWAHYILPVLNRSRVQKRPISLSKIFLKSSTETFSFQDVFKPYEKYLLREEDCLQFVHTLAEPETAEDSNTTANLKKWLEWCQGLSQCDRMKLANLLTEPRCRLCRYRILLAEILKSTDDKNEKKLLEDILEDSKSFLASINDELHKSTKNKELVTCLEQFDETTSTETEEDVIDNCFLAINFLRLPIKTTSLPLARYILDVSLMKLVKGRRTENVEVFVFSDVLVLAKLDNATRKLKIVNQLYFLDRLNFIKSKYKHNVILGLYLDEFGLLANTFSLELRSNKIPTWTALVERAKLCYEDSLVGKGTTYDFFKNNDDILSLEITCRKGALHGTIIRYESDRIEDVVSTEIISDSDPLQNEEMMVDTTPVVTLPLPVDTFFSQDDVFQSSVDILSYPVDTSSDSIGAGNNELVDSFKGVYNLKSRAASLFSLDSPFDETSLVTESDSGDNTSVTDKQTQTDSVTDTQT